MTEIIKVDGDTQAIRNRIAKTAKGQLKYIIETRKGHQAEKNRKNLALKSSKSIQSMLAQAKNRGKSAAARSEVIETELAEKKKLWEERKRTTAKPRKKNPKKK
jgi:flagellar hook-associated protein FlgK